MKQQLNPKKIDNDNPEWDDAMIANASTLAESSLPEAFKTAARAGRPRNTSPKQPISIRLSPDVLDYFRSSGKGWQTRLDNVLRDYISHSPG